MKSISKAMAKTLFGEQTETQKVFKSTLEETLSSIYSRTSLPQMDDVLDLLDILNTFDNLYSKATTRIKDLENKLKTENFVPTTEKRTYLPTVKAIVTSPSTESPDTNLDDGIVPNVVPDGNTEQTPRVKPLVEPINTEEQNHVLEEITIDEFEEIITEKIQYTVFLPEKMRGTVLITKKDVIATSQDEDKMEMIIPNIFSVDIPLLVEIKYPEYPPRVIASNIKCVYNFEDSKEVDAAVANLDFCEHLPEYEANIGGFIFNSASNQEKFCNRLFKEERSTWKILNDLNSCVDTGLNCVWQIQNVNHFFVYCDSRESVQDKINMHEMKSKIMIQEESIFSLNEVVFGYSSLYTEAVLELGEWQQNYIEKAYGDLKDEEYIEWLVLMMVHNCSKHVFPKVSKVLVELLDKSPFLRKCEEKEGEDPMDYKFSQFPGM
jgi:hypothetical protein